MASVRLVVGAQLDPRALGILEPLLAAVKRARAQIKSEASGMADDVAAGYRTAPAHARKAFSGAADEAEKADKRISASSARAARERAKDSEWVFQVRQRHLRDEERETERSAKKQADAAKSILRGSAGTFASGARGALGVAGQIARGAGVNLDIGSYVGKAVTAQSKALDIVNQAELAGQKQAPGAAGALVSSARDTADKHALDTNDTLSVLAAFQAKSSDLETGKATLGELASLAKATGTGFADMGKAAGAVNAQLVDIYANPAERAEKLLAIMRHITKQTADGSVEMADFAQYIGRLAANASRFEGGFEASIGELGALAQMAMKGGASTAAEATGSAAAFARDITKKKTLQKWEGEGINVFDKQGKIRGPEALTVDFLKKYGGSKDPAMVQRKLAEMFPNEVSKRGVLNSMQTYQEAGGGEKGISAVHKEYAKFRATVSPETVQELEKKRLDSMDAQVTRLNNMLERITSEALPKLVPAFTDLAPPLTSVAQGLASMAVIVAQNPIKSALALAAAAITKEAASIGLKALLEKALSGAGTTSFAIGGAATIGVAVGTIIAHKLDSDAAEGAETAKSKLLGPDEAIKSARKEFQDTGTLSEPTYKKLIAAQAEEQSLANRAMGPKISNFDVLNPISGKTAQQQGEQRELEKSLGNIQAALKDIAGLKAAFEASQKNKGVQKVEIVGGGMPAAPGTTTGPGPIRS